VAWELFHNPPTSLSPVRVMSAGRDPAVAAVHVCFAPKATTEPSHSNPPLSADIVAKVFF
jgi:hypothetical protein